MVRERGRPARAMVLACLLVCVLAFAAWPTRAVAASRCIPHGRSRCIPHGRSVAGVRTSRLIDVTSSVLFYVTAEPESHLYWACSRKANRFVLVSREHGAEVGHGIAERLLRPVHLAGNWLIATGVVERECDLKYPGEPPCEAAPDESLLVVDVAGALKTAISTVVVGTPARLSAALVSAAGAVAWLQTPPGGAASLLYGCVAAAAQHRLACPPRLLAQGPIPSASLRLTGMTLRWSAAGQQQSAVL
jgi:hypothetical protein